ncbi:MAG: kynurenine 3-monooxygenase [Moraxellaceae bacterium]|nr:MAG: kynurenine 3-monooxygenase [Moraxellaceae bacterium]
MKRETITLIGAGLVGSLLAIYLGRKGFPVEVYEKRPDMRKESISAGRSINLALANRGIAALKQVGVFEAVKKIIIAMEGREIHDLKGVTNFQPYGRREEEVIYSISRAALNCLLMDRAEATGNVTLFFNQSFESIDLNQNTITCQNTLNHSYDQYSFNRVIGTDGSNSKIKTIIHQRHDLQAGFDPLPHGYKELSIPADSTGQHQISPNALHIWPRGQYMSIALPNLDGSFTVTLFLPHEGECSFEHLLKKGQLEAFFKREFCDLNLLIQDLDQQFDQNPIGNLATVKSETWHYEDKLLILGDAAHAIVPFHGQGMNCGFEDCLTFNELLETESSWSVLFNKVQIQRKPNTDAIAEMSLENYQEMRSDVLDPKYRLKQAVAFKLEAHFPNQFIPRYSMVMFHRMPYKEAQQRSLIQARILDQLCNHIEHIDDLNIALAQELVNKELATPVGVVQSAE